MILGFLTAEEDVKRDALRWRDAVLATSALVPCLFGASTVQAGPVGGVVAHGSATIAQAGNLTTITQGTDRAVIDWQNFNISTAETARFVQPSGNSVAVNRVHDASASTIAGQLQANGHVVITNPNGVMFTGTAKVDVGGLTVSTASVNDMDAANFVSGARNDLPLSVAGNPNAKIINAGTITAKEAGLVGLVAPNVENSGIIRAHKGKVTLASGDSATLDLYGDGLVSLAVSSATEQRLVANAGMVEADGGAVLLTAASAADVANAVITVEGTLQANTVDTKTGSIILTANQGSIQVTGDVRANGSTTQDAGSIAATGQFVALGGNITANGKSGGTITAKAGNTLSLADRIEAKGITANGGNITLKSENVSWETSTSRLNADGAHGGGTIRHTAVNQIISSGQYSAKGAAGVGGKIDVTAKSVKFLSAAFDASGQTNGGQVRLGGEYQGGKNLPAGTDELKNADYLVFDKGSRINASSTSSGGNGGTAILWSEITTLALGNIQATPGQSAGNGGFVEISSAGDLQYGATVQTGLGGRAGTVLLDPKNIIIANSSFDPTAIILGYGYTGGNNVSVGGLGEKNNWANAVSLSGNNLAIGDYSAESFDGSIGNVGAVFLYSFTNNAFSGGTLQGVVGAGYTGGKNVNVTNLANGYDQFGRGLSLDGNRLAVGANGDDGFGNVRDASGVVYLFTFDDANFTNGTLQSTIGYGYTGGKNINLTQLDNGDAFGLAVSLKGTQLAVGAQGDDGFNNARSDSGAAYLFTFTDLAFSGGALQGRVGYGYAGAKDVNLANLDVSDILGSGIALSGNNSLAIGAKGDDGATNAVSNSGAVYLISFTNGSFSGGIHEGTIGSGYIGTKDTNVALDVSDQFGSVAMDGNRLAVGAISDDGFNNTNIDRGAVYLYTFTDAKFSGGVQEGTIGYGYTGGKNVDSTSWVNANGTNGFGVSVSLDGYRLVAGATYDNGEGYRNSVGNAALFFAFNDAVFTGGSRVGTAGYGYTGAKDINILLDSPDYYGWSTSLDNNRLAVGAVYDDGFGDTVGDAGAVYLYSFTNNNLDGGKLEAIIGKGYTGGKNYDLAALETKDYFGSSVSLDGNRLAVGARGDDGYNNTVGGSGAVYLFDFSDNVFSGATQQAIIGANYTGGKNLSISNLGINDTMGNAVSLDGNRIAIGAANDDGFANNRTDAGAVYLVSFADASFTAPTLQGTIGYGYTTYDITTLDVSDQFGISLSLDGNNLAIGASFDDGFGAGSNNNNYGAIYLFSFANSVFGTPTKQGTIGYGYTGGKSLDISSSLGTGDRIGQSVALEGTTLAAGAISDDGYLNPAGMTDSGAIYVFAMQDTAFTNPSVDLIIGRGYSGGKNIDTSLNSNFSGAYDYLGASLSIDNGTLAIGGYGFDGVSPTNQRTRTDAGAVVIYRTNAGTNVAGGGAYGTGSTGTLGLTPGSIAALLSTPQNVILQASNDILLSDNLTVNNPSGNGGTLTLQAGRNILINALITSDNGNVNLYANEKSSTGVVTAQREVGAAGISFGTNGAINAGTGAVHIRLDDGAGRSGGREMSGNISLGTITAGTLLVESAYQYSNLILNGILTASGAGNAMTLAPGGSFVNNVGSNALQLTGGGRWLLYTDHKNLNMLNGLTAQEQYNCPYNACTIPVSGNALLYQYGMNLLQISANGTRQYGDTNPTGAALEALLTYSGFINGDDTSDLTSQVSLSIAGTATATAGAGTQHEIMLSGATDDFYSIYYGPSALTIAKRDITATWTGDITKTYGDANPAIGNGNFNFTGLVNGDLATAITATGNFGAVTNLTGAGNYTIGALFDAANYNVINAPTTTLSIGKKEITATWIGGISKTYGDANPTVNSNNFNFSGLVNGDLASVITASANFGSITQGSNAGTYTNGVTGLFNAANYTVTNAPTTTLTINKRTLTPGLTGTVSKTYDGLTAATLALSNYSLANIYNSDDVSLTNFASGIYADKNADTGKSVSVTGLGLTGTKASNYQLSSSNVTGTIGTILKKVLTVTGATANGKVYDRLTGTTLANNGTLVGVIGSEAVTINGAGITASFDDTHVANGKAVTVSGYALSGTDAGNYSVSNPTGLTANITPATLTLSGITVNNKFYDGTVAALLNTGGTLHGVLGSDVVTLSGASATASFGDKNAGTGKAVTVSGYALAGGDAGNYVLTQPTGVLADIVAKTITIALGGTVSKTYDGNTNAALAAGNYTLNGAIVGDAVSLTGGLSGSYNDKNAGSGKMVSVTGLGLTGGDASNYVLSSSSVSGNVGTINRANLIVSAASGLSKIYGDLDPGFTYTYTGLVGGDSSASFTGNLSRNAGENAGLYTISLGTLAATGNYQIGSFNPATFTINKRAITAIVHDAARMYGDANPLLNWSNVTWSNLANGDTGASIDALSFNFGGANLVSNAGSSYGISIANFADNNYTLSGSTAGNLQIDKANLLIKAEDASSIAGQPLPLFTAQYIGLKNGETAAAVHGLKLFTDASFGSVGTFSIHGSDATATNYDISYAPGTLQMLPGSTLVPESVQQSRITNSIQRTVDTITQTTTPVTSLTSKDETAPRNLPMQLQRLENEMLYKLTGIVEFNQELQRQLQ